MKQPDQLFFHPYDKKQKQEDKQPSDNSRRSQAFDSLKIHSDLPVHHSAQRNHGRNHEILIQDFSKICAQKKKRRNHQQKYSYCNKGIKRPCIFDICKKDRYACKGSKHNCPRFFIRQSRHIPKRNQHHPGTRNHYGIERKQNHPADHHRDLLILFSF